MNVMRTWNDTMDLSAIAGLPLRLDRQRGILLAKGGLSLPTPSRRTLGDLAAVLADPAIARAEPDRVCYLLYRDVHLDSDGNRFRDHGLRYDITVLLPGRYGAEHAKTAGHFHSTSASGVPFPEVYEILHGQAAIILQWSISATPEMACLVQIAVCAAGDRLIIPPGAGHLTVNLGNEPLVMSNLVARASKNDYAPFAGARGAAVYLLAGSTAPLDFRVAPNPRHSPPATVRISSGSRWPAVWPEGPLYDSFCTQPGAFRPLIDPAADMVSLFAPWESDVGITTASAGSQDGS